MKTNVWVGAVCFAFFLILFFLYVHINKSVTDLEGAWLVQPEEQTVQERIWREIEFKQIGISDEFLNSENMTFSPKGFIYAEDQSRMVVNKFDMEANLTDRLGAGEGRGPGEFLNISNLRLDPGGNVWALDPLNSRATILDPENKEEWEIIEFSAIPLNVIPAGTDGYWLEKRFDNYLRRYTRSGELVGEVEVLVDDPPLWSGVLYSRFASTPDGSIIAAQYFTNYLVKYSREGKIEFFREPVSPPELIKIEPYYANDAGRVNSMDYTTWKQSTRNAYIVGNTIHVFIWSEASLNEERRLRWGQQQTADVYDLENGDYLYSYKLPDQLLAMTVSSTRLAGIPEELGQLVVWEVEGGWN